jgi:heterodisulfide reductase subunit A-like polyferredoxin
MALTNDEDVEIRMKPSNASPAALVIGGGIAGIQAALDIADAGFKVYLVEREPSIGGRMAQLDKTFPTLDCSSCILTPKMVDVARHPNIVLLTYSEVEAVEGEAGCFRIRVRKKARSVDMDKCTSCGLCAENCIIRYIPYVEATQAVIASEAKQSPGRKEEIASSQKSAPRNDTTWGVILRGEGR